MKDALSGPATVERSEGEAIARARRGDAGAFEYLYKTHCRHVYSVCFRMIKNPAEAEDLTQQTFLRVFSKDRDVPRRVAVFDLAAQGDCKHCVDASTPQK